MAWVATVQDSVAAAETGESLLAKERAMSQRDMSAVGVAVEVAGTLDGWRGMRGRGRSGSRIRSLTRSFGTRCVGRPNPPSPPPPSPLRATGQARAQCTRVKTRGLSTGPKGHSSTCLPCHACLHAHRHGDWRVPAPRPHGPGRWTTAASSATPLSRAPCAGSNRLCAERGETSVYSWKRAGGGVGVKGDDRDEGGYVILLLGLRSGGGSRTPGRPGCCASPRGRTSRRPRPRRAPPMIGVPFRTASSLRSPPDRDIRQ